MVEHLMATETYMLLESAQGSAIKGESLDTVHVNEIQLKSFEIGVSNQDKSAGEGDWKPDFPPLKVSVITSRATAFLFRAACEGTAFKRVTISCRKTGAKKTGPANGDYLQWRFHNVRVVDYNMSYENDEAAENIGMSYQAIEMVYIQQKQDGSLDEMFQRGWSVGKNTEFSGLTLPYKGSGAK